MTLKTVKIKKCYVEIILLITANEVLRNNCPVVTNLKHIFY